MTEINPANDWCQRWHRQHHSWRHKSEGGFNPDDYTVAAITEADAKEYVLRDHYSGTYPSAKYRYGLYRGDTLAGVMVLGIPTQYKALTNVFPDLEPGVESLDLSRFVLDQDVPGNGESWVIGQALNEAGARGVRGVISFADPCPRRVDGQLVFPGHVGTIYQATNATYCGRATRRNLLMLPDGTIFNDRAKQKVRAQERGHQAIEQRLIAMGARPIRAGEKPAAWLADAISRIDPIVIKHRGNHRYAFTLGTRSQRRRVRVVHTPGAYPKATDA